MAEQDIVEYLEQTPDITSGGVLDKESVIGSSLGGILDATKKLTQTLGNFRAKVNAILDNPIVTSLKSIGGRIIFNGEGNYDPTKNSVIIGGLKMQGVVDCTIKVDDAFDVQMGMAGEAVPVRSRKARPTMDLTLLRTSPSRKALIHAFTAMVSDKRGLLEVIIQDNGDTVFTGKAILTKLPDFKLDMEGSDVTYTFKFVSG